MSPQEKLSYLEETNQHVFHGSPDGTIKILEPRQSSHIPDISKPDEIILDGKPAVAATPHAELATFRAIINGKNIPIKHNSGFGTTGGKTHFRVSSAEVLEHAKGKKGYVYVFDRKDFKPYDRERSENPREGAMEWRAHTSVKPLEVIEVSSDDLPPTDKIEIGDKE